MNSIRAGVLWPLIIAGLLVLIYVWQVKTQADPGDFGLRAREISAFWGIFTCVLFHGNAEHLFNNMASFVPLTALLFVLYKPKGGYILFWCWILTGLLMFLFARGGVSHIGASGVVYAECAFLVTAGFLLPSRGLKMISVLVLIFYGSMVWGIFPLEKQVSWDGHLCGMITGIALAWYYSARFKDKHEDQTPDWANDETPERDEYANFGD